MNRKIFAISLLTLCVVAAAFGSVLGQGVSERPKDEAAVLEVLRKSTLSFEKNDRPMASEVWANDESLTVFEQGHANYGWADYRDHHLFPEMSEMKNTKYSLGEIKLHLSGETAWATFTYAISGDITEDGKTRHVSGGGLGTAVLEKRQGKWRIAHWHSSAPRRAPAPAPKPTK